MARKPLPAPANPLAFVFAELWATFLDNQELDGFQLEQIIEHTGLATWREATEEDVKASKIELELGDPILCLTKEGLAVVAEGRKVK